MEVYGWNVMVLFVIIVMGVLFGYIIGGYISCDDGVGKLKLFQFMNVNFGFFLLVEVLNKDENGKCLKGKDKMCVKKLVMIECVKVDFVVW